LKTRQQVKKVVTGRDEKDGGNDYRAMESASLGTSAEGLWTWMSMEVVPSFDAGELTLSSGRTGGSLDIPCRAPSSPVSIEYADEARGTSTEGLGVAAIVVGLDAVGARFAPGPTTIVAGGGSGKSHGRGTIAAGMILDNTINNQTCARY
jgi:hypothetical protein